MGPELCVSILNVCDVHTQNSGKRSKDRQRKVYKLRQRTLTKTPKRKFSQKSLRRLTASSSLLSSLAQDRKSSYFAQGMTGSGSSRRYSLRSDATVCTSVLLWRQKYEDRLWTEPGGILFIFHQIYLSLCQHFI